MRVQCSWHEKEALWRKREWHVLKSRKLQACGDTSTIKLFLSCIPLVCLRKAWNLLSGCDHTTKMSSIYLSQSSGFKALLDRNVYSSCPMKVVASAGASLVPMARPQVCLKTKLSISKMLLLRTNFNRSERNWGCGWPLKTFMTYICVDALFVKGNEITIIGIL